VHQSASSINADQKKIKGKILHVEDEVDNCLT